MKTEKQDNLKYYRERMQNCRELQDATGRNTKVLNQKVKRVGTWCKYIGRTFSTQGTATKKALLLVATFSLVVPLLWYFFSKEYIYLPWFLFYTWSRSFCSGRSGRGLKIWGLGFWNAGFKIFFALKWTEKT